MRSKTNKKITIGSALKQLTGYTPLKKQVVNNATVVKNEVAETKKIFDIYCCVFSKKGEKEGADTKKVSNTTHIFAVLFTAALFLFGVAEIINEAYLSGCLLMLVSAFVGVFLGVLRNINSKEDLEDLKKKLKGK